MTAYDTYKPAVLPWLDAIPSHWDAQRIKFHYREIDNRSVTGDEEMLSVSHITGVTPRSQKNVNMFLSESNVGQKVIQPADIAVNTMWAWMAAMGVSKYSGIVSPSYGVYRPIAGTYNPAYLDYLLRIEKYRAEYVRRSTGVTSSRLRLYPDKFLDIRFPYPPIQEQDHIVRYLDWRVSQINKIVHAKRRQIMLLLVQRRTVIDSLIGDATSVGSRFRHLFTLSKGLGITKADLKDEGIPCVSYGEVHSKYGFEVNPDVHVLKCVDESYILSSPKSLLSFGDYVFADTSEDIAGSGNFTYLNSHTKTFAGYHTIIARANKPVNYRYFAYLFDSNHFRQQIQSEVNGVKVYSITRAILNRTSIRIPDEAEQERLVAALDKQCSYIDRSVSLLRRELELFAEYRTRLISDVITGKLDVRGVVVPEYETVGEVVGDVDAEDEAEEMESVE